MTLTPPPHICGTLTRKADRGDRSRWIASLPAHVTTRQIANALGISMEVAANACPQRVSKVPQAVAPAAQVHVSVAELPFGIEADDRSATAPRAGVVTPARKSLTIEERIEVIRQMWINTRAAA